MAIVNREFERRFDAGYLEELVNAYNEFFFHYTDTPLLVINTSDIDFEANAEDREPLVREILRTKSGVHHYIPLGGPPRKDGKKEKP